MSVDEPGDGRQLTLLPVSARRRSPRAPAEVEPAGERPVARVAVDVPFAHLDRPFDYLVTDRQAEAAAPGVRVRVRFAGRLVDGFVLERVPASDHGGRLARLHRVVSGEPVLSPELARLARAVAHRYAGTLADVLRLAVPARHARVEAERPGLPGSVPRAGDPTPGDSPWRAYTNGASFLDALASGRAPRAVWPALPGAGWTTALAHAVAVTVHAGRGALVVVPDARAVTDLDEPLRAMLGADAVTVLTADLGPAERYRRWLAVRRGLVRVVLGTRAAAYAPVADLGLVAIWDDGHDLHAEPRAPYPHAREVLCLRAHDLGCAALFGGHTVTAETAALLERGWAHPLRAPRAAIRRHAPRVQALGADADAHDPTARHARLPSAAWRAAREGLARGPVLVQVPRRGYLPAVACSNCRARARCRRCGVALGIAAEATAPACGRCGTGADGWACPDCGTRRLRAVHVGAARTAEELTRALPGVPMHRFGGGGARPDAPARAVPAEPALVIATPGAEPPAVGGYAAGLLLDGGAALARPDLRVGEETLRRWMNAAALVRPADDGGRVVVIADPALAPVRALVRWDPVTFAERELAERGEVGLPPAVRLVTLVGAAAAVHDLLDRARLPADACLLGPTPVADPEDPSGVPPPDPPLRALIRVPIDAAPALCAAVAAARAERSAARAPGTVRVQVDPLDLGS